MNISSAVLALALVLTPALACAANPRVPVTVIQNIPTTVSYDQADQRQPVLCTDTACSPYYMPRGSATLDMRGAHLQLLLPTGQVLVAECFVQQDRASYYLEALAGGYASPSYRSCRIPDSTSKVEVQLNGNKVKLFMQNLHPEGWGPLYTETYQLKTIVKQSAPAPLVAEQATR